MCDICENRTIRNMWIRFTLMWKQILTPSSLRNELRNCYKKYSNDLHYIDTRLINVAYMKFASFCVHSIKKYWLMSKWCVSFFAGYIYCRKAFGKHRDIQNNIDDEMKLKFYFISRFWLNLFQYIERYLYNIYL